MAGRMSLMTGPRQAGAGGDAPPGAGVAMLYVLAAIAFPALAQVQPGFALAHSGVEHAIVDLVIALTAVFCGLQSLMRYGSRAQPVFLWLGIGFLASGALDVMHSVLSLPGWEIGDGRVRAWAWLLSDAVLGLYLALGLGQDRPKEGVRPAVTNSAIVAGVTLALLALLVLTLSKAPLPAAQWPGHLIRRPWELLPAAAMVLALEAAWHRWQRLEPPLRRPLFTALILYVALHAGVRAWSAGVLDAPSAFAHVAKLLGHLLVLFGLLRSSASLLSQAEEDRRRLAAQAELLEASERHIRSIVNHAPYAILTADESGVIRDINPVAAQLFGLSQGQAAGRPLTSFFHESLHEQLAGALGPGEHATRARLLQLRQGQGDEMQRSRRAVSQVAQAVRGDGSTFPIALTLTDVVAGGQHFFTAFVRDLTRAMEQERKIDQALKLASAILDKSGVAIFSTDPGGLITRFNGTAQQWLGYDEAEVLGLMTPAAFIDPGELQQRAESLARDHNLPPTTTAEILLAPIRLGEARSREWTLVRKDGSRFPASVTIGPLTAESGEIQGYVLVVNDLSHQKEVESLKNEFVSTVSHELRTPLTSVRGSLGLLAGGLAGPLPPQAQSLLEIAHRNTERLILLINDILDIEKIEAGKMRFSFRHADLDAIAGDALQTAEGLAATRSVRLVRRAQRPGTRVYVDEHRLLQVIGNLLSNAIKFSPEGGEVTLDVVVEGSRARLSVTDRGPGIPESAQPRIFQKFFQADSSSAREKSGTGLGLAICKALVERMDGQLGFLSRPGETTFSFELPCEAGAAGIVRVLVVEDDADSAAVLCHILRQAGMETDTAPSAGAARELLRSRRYDCVTLDVMLPDASGLAFAGELRREDHGRALPIIVVSIYEADAQAQAAAAAARVAAWLTKPVDAARLLQAVREAMGRPATDAETVRR